MTLTTATAATGPRRARSLGGCGTCRSRHAKCDESRPECQVCKTLGLECEGYQIRLIFDVNDSEGSRCRRPLFTVPIRQRMSEELAASVNPGNVDTLLTQMDDECEEPEEQIGVNFNARLGPFGAFRMAHTEPIKLDAALPALKSPVPVPANSTVTMDIDEFFSNDPLLESLFWDVESTMGFQDGVFFSTNLSPSVNLTDNAFASPPSMTDSPSRFMDNSGPIGPSLLPLAVHNMAPNDAPFLLSYYKDEVVRLFSPIHYDGTPWETLHVPKATETLGQLTMGQSAPNARMCIFYAILATSAFAQRVSPSQGDYQFWQNKADLYSTQAQGYLKMALQDISSSPEKVKYKEILIALLCMTTVSAYQGSETRIRRCLLDCERWICLRGLPKKQKSRKVRLLHHCYVYLRIFHESTSVSQEHMSPVNGTSGSSFRLRQWDGRLDQRMSELKDKSLGENDLHLEVPGRWDSTMYPQIFGIPESFFFLLSQVTRLANERDLSESDDCVGPLDLKQFSTRARSLEKCICACQPPPLTRTENPNGGELFQKGSAQPNNYLIHHMLTALHNALRIFFYRRIYDVDAAILQDKVRQIKESLSLCDELGVPAVRLAASFVWAAFVAACEALDQTLQSWFCEWFDTSAEKSGLQICKIAKTTAKQVWERASQPVDSNGSAGWPQIMRENHQCLFYV